MGILVHTRKASALLATLLATLVLVLLAGCGSTASTGTRASATSTPTPVPPTPTATPLPSGFQMYTDPGGYFELAIPYNWTAFALTNGTAGQGFNAPDQSADFVVTYVAGTTLTSSDVGATTKSFFASESKTAGGSGTYSHVQGPSQLGVGGATWTKEEADVDVGAGNSPLHTVVLLVDHNHTAFIVGYAAVDFTTARDSDYSTMLKTFRFLK